MFFAGWGMDDRPFRRLTSLRFDVLVCYDYRDPGNTAATAELSAVAEYPDVTVIAWSLGCRRGGLGDVSARLVAARRRGDQRHGDTRGRRSGHSGAVDVRHCRRIGRRRLAEVRPAHVPGRGRARRLRSARAGARLGERSGGTGRPAVLVAPSGMRLHTGAVGTRDRIILPENQQRGWERLGVPFRRFVRRTIPFTSGGRGSKCWPPVLRPRNLATQTDCRAEDGGQKTEDGGGIDMDQPAVAKELVALRFARSMPHV